MAETIDKPKALRIIHLPGGCRAVNGFDQNVIFEPDALNGKKAGFITKTYGQIFSDLESLNLKLIGVDFYSHSLEFEGITPPNWRSFHRCPETVSVWQSEDETQRWSQIGHAAFSRNNTRLWDIASRISHQLRVCSWRLRQISESYNDQLNARIKGKNTEVGARFVDGYTWLAYLAIQAFLVDACVLRDYMAEFYALVLCPEKQLAANNSITSMAGLKSKVLDKISAKDHVTKALQIATNQGGWLYELGAYRDLVVHSAPLAKAQRQLFAVTTELRLGNSGGLLAINLPIPADPHAVKKARATGKYYEDIAGQYEIFVHASMGEVEALDGMMYAHDVLGQLSILAGLLADQSPIPPEIPRIDETDIISFTKSTNV